MTDLEHSSRLGTEYVLVLESPLVWGDSRVIASTEHAIAKTGLTVVERACHSFAPQGVTCVWILSESHVVVSTWPEREIAIWHVFVCTDGFQLSDFLAAILESEQLPGGRVHFAAETFSH